MIRKRITDRMDELGISQTELGRVSGIPQPTIHRIITGESQSPRQENVLKIAKALGVSANWLWTGKQDLFPIPSTSTNKSEQSEGPAFKRAPAKPDHSRTKLEIKVVDHKGSRTYTSREQEKLLVQALQGFIDSYVHDLYWQDLEFIEELRTFRLAEMKLLFVDPLKSEKA